MNNTDLELKRKRIEAAVKIAAMLGVGFLVAPFVFVAIQGLVGLLVAGAIGITCINFAPWAAAKLANWRLKALKHEAAKNPVETLQNDYVKRETALAQFAEAIKVFSSKVASFKDKVELFKKQYPEDAPKFANQLDKMRTLLDLRKEKFRIAKRALEDYALEIEKAGAIWEMGLAAAEMSKAAGMTESDFFAKIQTETALNSIQETMNKAFAEVEMSLVEEDSESDKQVSAQLNRGTENALRDLQSSAPSATVITSTVGNSTSIRR